MAIGRGTRRVACAIWVTMDRAQVALVRCTTYRQRELTPAVHRACDLLGGLEKHLRPTDRVLVKVNHLSPPSPPERAIVTHPEFTRAVLEHIMEITPHVAFGDDVQGEGDPFAVSGYRKLASELGAQLINFKEHGFHEIDCSGQVLDKLFVARDILEADVVVNLPKLKTHSLTTLTGAVKNLYGTIPAGHRSHCHGRFSKPEEFAQALVDIYAAVPPTIQLMDAVKGMEGEGPAGGQPRDIGYIVAGFDGVAVDAIAARLIGLDPQDIGMISAAHWRGVGVGDTDDIDLVGDTLEDAVVPGFQLPSAATTRYLRRVPAPIARLFTGQLSPRPTIHTARCVGCAACANICPTGAAAMHQGKAHIARRRCIRCMCCHEVCRYDAVLLQRPPHGRALHRIFQAARRGLSTL